MCFMYKVKVGTFKKQGIDTIFKMKPEVALLKFI